MIVLATFEWSKVAQKPSDCSFTGILSTNAVSAELASDFMRLLRHAAE